MSYRHAAAIAAISCLALTPALAAAQSAGATARTPWGDPDIQGIWDYRTLTPLERPEELGDKAFLTEEEAAELERETLARNEFLLNRPAETTTAADQVCERAVDGRLARPLGRRHAHH